MQAFRATLEETLNASLLVHVIDGAADDREFLKTEVESVLDEIGAGALECMTKGIPTMIYWKKIHCREALHSKLDIQKLKDCGVLFEDLDQLTEELNIFFKISAPILAC